MIRLATLEDARTIAQIQVEAWQAAYRGLLPGDYLEGFRVEAREAVWQAACGREEAPLWVRIMDEETAGFCHVTRSRDDDGQGTVEVTSIYLLPQQWRRGLGRELLATVLDYAAEQGFERISLWVLVENLAARQFYEALGFRPDGRLKQETGPRFCLNEMRYVREVTTNTEVI
jgi:RimJ/RimL family protein N-acetyltransferase